MSATAQDVGAATSVAESKTRPPLPRTIDPGHTGRGAQATPAGVDHLSSGAMLAADLPKRDSPRSTPDAVGYGNHDTHPRAADGYLHLRAIAEVYEDIQRVRIAVNNRIDRAPIDPEMMASRLGGIKETEHQIGLLLRRTFRRVVEPEIVGWQAQTIGVGEHLLARLLGVIGHPVHTTVHAWEGEGADRVLVVAGEKERRVSDLWSYCGHGDATRRPRKGMSAADGAACGNPRAKMIVHLMAESCLKAKARSPYGPVYDEARVRYEDRDWTALHRHNAALRLVGKEILRDLWSVAR